MLKKFFKKILLSLMIIVFIAVLAACGGDEGNANKQFKVGLLTNNPNGLRNVVGFQAGLAELGYIEGENLTYIFAGGPVAKDDLEAALQEMITAEVDLIFTAGTPVGVVAHQATQGTNIPVVFGVIADPIAAGVLTDLKNPGGNMTGVRLSQNEARRLELLLEIAPTAKRIFIPFNPTDSAPASSVATVLESATALGVEIITYEAPTDEDVTALLNNFPQDIDAIFLVPDSVVNSRLQEILAVAEERKLPVSGPSTAQVEEGALTSYGFIHNEVGVQAARIADQILKGTPPGELPVEPAEFYLSVNLATAEKIGIEISDEILEQATLIIRE